MLEILVLIWLWRVNGANARARGQSAFKYRMIMFALWFGLEILGTFMGTMLCSIIAPNIDPFMPSYIMGVLGASLGGLLSYHLAKNCPLKNVMNNQEVISMNPSGYTIADTNIELLQIPATVRIIEQLGGYGAQKDQFYLNGHPICALAPGMGYEFKTNRVKNIITLGTAYCDAADTMHSVRFIASDNGVVEIHAAAGKLIPELFKNYTE